MSLQVQSNFIKLDDNFDAIPFFSTVTNLVDLFLKYVFIPCLEKSDIANNSYYLYIKEKPFYFCFISLIHVIGNIAILILKKYIIAIRALFLIILKITSKTFILPMKNLEGLPISFEMPWSNMVGLSSKLLQSILEKIKISC